MDRKMMAASTSMLLLKLLEEEDLYGYQMIRRLEARSDNVFSLKARWRAMRRQRKTGGRGSITI